MTYAALALWSALLVAAGPVTPSPTLGKAEAACRPKETGPALIVHVVGLKDRKGLVRAEVYPANDADFLQDDAILRSEEHTSELQSLMRNSSAVFCLKKKKN